MRSVSAFRRSRLRTLLAAGAVLVGAACWSGKELDGPGSVAIEDVITQVAVENTSIVGTLVSDGTPTPAGGPVATVEVQSPAVLGGSVRIVVTSPTAFQTLSLGAGEGVTGFYRVDLPAPVTQVSLIVTVSQAFNFSPIPAMFSLTAPGGPEGDATVGLIEVLRVGTGEVQVSAAWDAQTDVDLHVIDPNGEEIYWAHTNAASGGMLDLDSNAGCMIDGKRNENVTWPFGSAPRGTYTVRLDYWSACGKPQTRWVVTVRVQGQSPQTFTGTFTGSGDEGGAGSGEQIVQFTY